MSVMTYFTEARAWLTGGCCAEGGRLEWSTPVEWLGAGLLLLALGLLLGWRTPAGLDGAGGRWVERLLWLIGLGLTGLMLAGPVWVMEGERQEEGRLVVLVDTSRSMHVRGEDGEPRSKQVTEILEKLPKSAEILSFGDGLKLTPPLGYDDPETDLGGSLQALWQRYAGERLSGVVVLTDGLDRGGLRRRLMAGGEVSALRLGGPLTIYQVGAPGELVDAAVLEVLAGGYAFIHSPFHVDVIVEAHGHTSRKLAVSLNRDGQPVGTQIAELDDQGRGKVRFEVTESQEGRYLYEASVPVIPRDAIPANNSASLAVRLVRDRVRVLQVCGAPSWDQKFLRLFLKEDPGIDLVSFFILRTNEDMGSGYRSSELSLIEFPYETLFEEDLKTFDLVILQNYNYAPYFKFSSDRLLKNIADYVKEGGALVMLGGDRSFDLGRYAGTPVAEVLPVRLGVQGDAVDTAEFRPVMTDAGARHPITRIAPEEGNRAAWERLAGFYGINLSLGVAPGAAVLLTHPTLRDPEGRALPVLAVGEYGLGRSMALMGDSSWRWFLSEAGEGRGNQAYLRFWKNSMRWLIGDAEDRPVTVELARENYQQDEDVRIVTRVRDISFAPVAGASVRAVIEGQGGPRELKGVTGADGSAVLGVKAGRRGAFRVTVDASRDGQRLGEAKTVFAVSSRDPELEEVEPDGAFLQQLATMTGGRYVAAGAWEEPVRDPEAGRKVRDRKELPLKAAPILPILIGIALSGAWWLRRKVGLR